MSGEELRDIVATHEQLSAEERELIDEVFEAGNRELPQVLGQLAGGLAAFQQLCRARHVLAHKLGLLHQLLVR